MKEENINDLYQTLGHVWCQALNEDIAFTSAGLRHLTWKNKKIRSRRDRERRAALLPYAKEIIEDPAAAIAYRESENMRSHKFWALSKSYGKRTITVVIRQIEAKEKHFFSIFDG